MSNDDSIFSDMDAQATEIHRMAAAMFAALGDKTELSASGHSVIFKPEHRLGRADLSGNPDVARQQLEHAGIDPDAVTDEQINAYSNWFDEMYETRRVADARIVITAKFNEPYSGGMGACGVFNRVRLIDGWGNSVDSARVECKSEMCQDVINRIGLPGAVVARPDYDSIEEVIARMRRDRPEFAETPVHDNNTEGVGRPLSTKNATPKMGM